MPKKPKAKLPAGKSLPAKKAKTTAKPVALSGGWNSTNYSKNRTAIYAPVVQDQRRDLSPRDRIEMMRRIRWGDRNSGMVRQILGDLVQYGIGDGIKHQSHSKNAKLLEDYFTEWCKKCDITGRFSFWQVQSILLRSAGRDGDAFAIKARNAGGDPKLQLVEAHRVGNPLPPEKEPEGMHDGIRFGAYGELVSYNVYRSDNSSREIIAPAVMHIVDHEYASGARGVPILQHSWNDIQDEMEILALEKTGVKTSAQISLVINKNGGTIDDNMAAELGATSPTNYGDIAASMGGNILALDVGESVQSVQSNRPSPTFSGFLEAIQRDISRGVLPYEFIGDPSKTNGGALRLVVAKADRVFQKWQNIIIEQLCIPTWGYVIGDAIAKGELPDDPDWNKVSWTTPKRVTVDAGREAANDRADVELGLLSMSELYAQRGLDFRSEMAKRAQDMKFIVDLANSEGVPLWTLYKPGFNWLQKGEGKPTQAEIQMNQMSPGFEQTNQTDNNLTENPNANTDS